MKKIRGKFMEYPDAPSGNVALYHYKEPFMKFEEGFGFRGVLLADEETTDIQCHLCGEWFEDLSVHLHREHNMLASQYRDLVGLNKHTSLLSDYARAKLVHVHQDRCEANLRPHSTPHSAATRKKISDEMKKNWERRIETKNLKGTCILQLINRIKDFYNTYGRVPSERDFNSTRGTFKRVFGSWSNAIKRAGLRPNKTGGHALKSSWRYTDEQLIDAINDFFKQHQRVPSNADCSSGAIPSLGTYQKHFGGLTSAIKQSSIPSDTLASMEDRARIMETKRVPMLRKLLKEGKKRDEICNIMGIMKSHFYRVKERLEKGL